MALVAGARFAELLPAAVTSWPAGGRCTGRRDHDRERHALHLRVDRDAPTRTRVQLICPDFDLMPDFTGVFGGTLCYRHGTQTGIFETF
jgi:hypothetical protein